MKIDPERTHRQRDEDGGGVAEQAGRRRRRERAAADDGNVEVQDVKGILRNVARVDPGLPWLDAYRSDSFEPARTLSLARGALGAFIEGKPLRRLPLEDNGDVRGTPAGPVLRAGESDPMVRVQMMDDGRILSQMEFHNLRAQPEGLRLREVPLSRLIAEGKDPAEYIW